MSCLFNRRDRKKARVEISSTASEQAEMNEINEEWVLPRVIPLVPASDSRVPPSNCLSPQHIASEFLTQDQFEAVMRDQQPDPQPDNQHPPRNFTEFTRGTFYKSRRVKEHERWMEQLKPMFTAYLVCLGKTSDWGDQGKWNQDWNTPCSCPSHRTSVRELDVVDILCEFELPYLTFVM